MLPSDVIEPHGPPVSVLRYIDFVMALEPMREAGGHPLADRARLQHAYAMQVADRFVSATMSYCLVHMGRR